MSAQHDKPRMIGVALGSGGARGLAHVGVLSRLRELGVPIHCVAGTSIGSIVGTVYATGRLDTLHELATQLDWRHAARLFLEVNLPRSGLLSGKNIMSLLKDIIPARQFSDLPLPLRIVATDLLCEKEVVFSSGNLFDAIRASIAIPGIFTPPRLRGRNLIDGGLVNPLPFSAFRSIGADTVIAGDINLHTPEQPRKPLPYTAKHTHNTRSLRFIGAAARTHQRSYQSFKGRSKPRSTRYAPQERGDHFHFRCTDRSFRLVETNSPATGLAMTHPTS